MGRQYTQRVLGAIHEELVSRTAQNLLKDLENAYKPRVRQKVARSKLRYTQFTRARFDEIKKLWLDGSLLEKWEKIQAGQMEKTKAAQVEERQIRAVAAIYSETNPYVLQRLNDSQWKELIVYRDAETGVFSAEIV